MAKQRDKVYVVMDTNVFVRAVAGYEPEHAAEGTLIRVCHSLAVSTPILEEYERVIYKYGSNPFTIQSELLKLHGFDKLKNFDKSLEHTEQVKVAINRKDVPFVETALAANATYLITQDDHHLLSKRKEISEQHGINVLLPSQYSKGANESQG